MPFLYIILEGVWLPGEVVDDPGDQAELYVMVAGNNGHGLVSGVHPGPLGSAEDIAGRTFNRDAAPADKDYWWNIDQNMQQPRLLNHTIWREPIEAGQSHLVSFTFMEQNENSFDDARAVAGVLANIASSVFPHPIVIAADTVIQTVNRLFGRRKDEFRGSFTVIGDWAGNGDPNVRGFAGGNTLSQGMIGRGFSDSGAPGFRFIISSGKAAITIFLRCFVQDN